MKFRTIRLLFIIVTLYLISNTLNAATPPIPPPPGDTDPPSASIDGDISILLISGLMLGIYVIRNKKLYFHSKKN